MAFLGGDRRAALIVGLGVRDFRWRVAVYLIEGSDLSRSIPVHVEDAHDPIWSQVPNWNRPLSIVGFSRRAAE